MDRESVDRVGVIGGGRWARTLAHELDACLPATTPMTLASASNPASWEMWIREHRKARTVMATSIPGLLNDHSISHVLIARKAAQHAQTILECLAAGKHVFVEKPFCTSLEECHRLLDVLRGRSCTVGYVLLYSYSLHQFVAECHKLGEVQSIAILWTDPIAEFRHGEPKQRDDSISVMQDVFPHVWSIVRAFHPEATLRLASAVALDPRRDVEYLRLHSGECDVAAICGRGQRARTRQIFVQADQGTACLDFTVEPGRFTVNDVPIEGQIAALGPLRAEIKAFLGGPCSASYCSLSELTRSTDTVLVPLNALRWPPCTRMPPSELLFIRDTLKGPFVEATRKCITTVDFFGDSPNCPAEAPA